MDGKVEGSLKLELCCDTLAWSDEIEREVQAEQQNWS